MSEKRYRCIIIRVNGTDPYEEVSYATLREVAARFQREVSRDKPAAFQSISLLDRRNGSSKTIRHETKTGRAVLYHHVHPRVADMPLMEIADRGVFVEKLKNAAYALLGTWAGSDWIEHPDGPVREAAELLLWAVFNGQFRQRLAEFQEAFDIRDRKARSLLHTMALQFRAHGLKTRVAKLWESDTEIRMENDAVRRALRAPDAASLAEAIRTVLWGGDTPVLP